MANEGLFISVFVYLLAAVISATLFKRLGLGSVLGYLVAGVVIGPFCLGFVGSEGGDVMDFAGFGVVMMLFLVGLELQPALLWKLRGPIVGLGGGQVIGTTVAFMAVGMAAGLNWQMSLAIGMALSLSSTVIVLQYLQENGQSNSTAGRSAFAVLLAQDIAVIPMLSILPILVTLEVASGGVGEAVLPANPIQAWLAGQPGWVNTLLVLAAVVGIIIIGRTVLSPVLRAVAATRVREAFVALALVIVIGIALLMTSLGVSAALGTFLAGVVLADSEYRHELEADIEPFKGLLLGVFFIAVGASIDFEVIQQNPLIVGGMVLGILGLKALVHFVLSTVARLILDQRMIFSLSLAQGSEFAFVLLGSALAAGVLTVEIVQMLIASIAVSMGLTPIVMIFEEKVLRRRLGTQEQEERSADAMDEDAPVILAGVGRFGNFIARMFQAQKIPVTVIDSDADHVEFLRKIGIKTFYGNVARQDLLEAAGAARARLLVIAIDDEEEVARLLQLVKKYFPHLKILVRALSRNHNYTLIYGGVDVAVHQHAGSAIWLGEQALVALGYRSHRAARAARRFFKHDQKVISDLAGHQASGNDYIEQVRIRMAELESQFEAEKGDKSIEEDSGWDNSRLRNDTVGKDPNSVIGPN
ncbi:MAG: cation:proton antiporter [Opitutales bacterium]|nr:cation:proton antiporter [Opitutales bacterium]